MRKSGLVVTILLLLMVLFSTSQAALAVSDGFYQLSETTPVWDGTDASRTKSPDSNYDYVYGDESSESYNLPWNINFYGTSYNRITADTNGNIWFTASDAAQSYNLLNTGRGPVIAAWNNDLSSYLQGGVFIQHKTNPERIVIEWQVETFTEEGNERLNNFEVVIFSDGSIRTDYYLGK